MVAIRKVKCGKTTKKYHATSTMNALIQKFYSPYITVETEL